MELYDNSDDNFESEEAGFGIVQMDQGMEESHSDSSRGKQRSSIHINKMWLKLWLISLFCR